MIVSAGHRGKMSEGIDFADRHGRAVIVTGLFLSLHVIGMRLFFS